ncbi:UDP-N-acetylmuramate--L-alanine ligase [Desulfogranum mediterraneum]|uniref:UDP-N-acetylmuramate--L-alanine ligase n=1 Tax=Desulfogranum mediterraneum TaxID=160661 RepID=UPI00040EB62D|nr:UDP-N-acetylmuramate--L-alanine ligase [Desulfogranum mediterraneum]
MTSSAATASLEPALNRCPPQPRHIHLIGICGTGMAALAGMLKTQGYRVTGSDQNVYPPMSDFLAEEQIPVLEGYSAAHLEPAPDLVIVGNVVRASNPEAIGLADRGLPYLSMPQALAHFFLSQHQPLVVTGTHGKTTTSSLLASTLHRLGATPGFMIGGIVEAFGANYHLAPGGEQGRPGGGAGPAFFVVEGDEYDTAFFNKVSKFQHYRPQCAILTSVEFDHADIFADLEAIKDSFREFIHRIPDNGLLVANTDDPLVAELAQAASCPVLSYGFGRECSWQVSRVEVRGLATDFRLSCGGRDRGRFTVPMPGAHNVLNATAVIALLDHLGFPLEAIAPGVAAFEGVKRRQQVRGCEAGVTVVDDFAHHPTAVRETVKALRMAWPGQRLIVVFEPRTNSSRRAVFQELYSQVFDPADQVIVREHLPLADIPPQEQFSSVALVQALRERGLKADYQADTEAILCQLTSSLRPGDVVAILSNGGFDNIHQRLLAELRDFP